MKKSATLIGILFVLVGVLCLGCLRGEPTLKNEDQKQSKSESLAQEHGDSGTQNTHHDIFKNAVTFRIQGESVKAIVMPPEIVNEDEQKCLRECEAEVFFDSPKLVAARIPQSLDAVIQNLGDLDDDGNDELGALPQWWQSTWQGYRVMTYKNGRWTELIEPISIKTDIWHQNPFLPVLKDPAIPKGIIVKTMELSEDFLDVVTISKKIQLP